MNDPSKEEKSFFEENILWIGGVGAGVVIGLLLMAWLLW